MAFIDWIPALGVGNRAIDAQHRALIDIINRLDEARASGTDRGALAETIAELDDYTREHFGLEERLFTERGYPEAEAHVKEHGFFVGRIVAFRRDFEAGKAELTKEILDFLKSWLTKHISLSDRKYRAWLSEAD
jgi:methyl-accepting chemotaxis protein/hemerythrin